MDEFVTSVNKNLKFHTKTELERYRVETIFHKEPETIKWIEYWSNSKSNIFFDIGANIGIYGLYCSSLRNNQIFCFEPEKKNFLQLVSNIELNNFKNINAFNIGISNENKLLDLNIPDLRIGNSGAQLASSYSGNIQNTLKQEKVIALTIDTLVKDLDFPVPNFIKIDVDGIESLILKGMSNTLTNKNLKSILVEFNDFQEYKKNVKYLKQFGFGVDNSFDNIKNHSTKRRIKNNSKIRNYIFSKE